MIPGAATNDAQFNSQQNEFMHLLNAREKVVDHISRNPDETDSLYKIAESVLNLTVSPENIAAREQVLNNLNLHILKVVYEDSDKKVVHFRHITRVVPEFFTEYLDEGQRGAITQLHITGVHIKELPESIGTLTGLIILNLNMNELRFLPKALGGMISLTDISVCDNQISSIDDAILRLPRLHWLAVTNNKLSNIERERVSNTLSERQVKFVDDTPIFRNS